MTPDEVRRALDRLTARSPTNGRQAVLWTDSDGTVQASWAPPPEHREPYPLPKRRFRGWVEHIIRTRWYGS